MEHFWNDRYSSVDFAYGEEPNDFFKSQLAKIKPGKILLPGDGEGRNGVCAARQGWQVESFDISSEGKKKAEQLAAKHELKINYQVGALENLTFEPESFDVIALIFTHFDPKLRGEYRKEFIKLLKPGGVIIFEAFSKEHLAYNTANPKVGGPKDINYLSSMKQVEREFEGLETIEIYQVDEIFNEGDFHVGEGNVVRYVGKKI